MSVICKALIDEIFLTTAPLASTLPCPEFPTAGPSSSTQLETGLCQMSQVITAMLETALLDQGSQGESKKNTWKTVNQGGTATPRRWEKEEDEVGNILFFYLEFFSLPPDL